MTSPNSPSDNEPASMQRIAHNPTSARVPEKVARGAVATGVLVYFGQNEFVLDFLQFISRPPMLAARVVMAPAVTEQFLAVLKENLARHAAQFGPTQQLPKNPNDKPRPAHEIYEDLKLSDDQLSGVYANAVLVGHTPAEFGFDFITSFLPNAVVSARVYLAAPRVPQLIETLTGLLAQYQRQRGTPPPPQQPPQNPPNFGSAPGIPGFPPPPGSN